MKHFTKAGLACVLYVALLGLGSVPAGKPAGMSMTAAAAFARLPLAFEPDLAGYVARGAACAVALEPTGASLTLSSNEGLRLRIAGANPDAALEGAEPLPGKMNYFLGNDPSKWRVNVPTYARVRAAGVYPGVDVEYYGNNGSLEYDFIVAPGADPGRIRVAFDGASGVEPGEDGELRIGVGAATLTQHKPLIYQERPGGRVLVDGRCVMTAEGEIGFELADYDRSLALVIDPVLDFGTYLGGGGIPRAVCVDAAGNVYVTGGEGALLGTPGAFNTAPPRSTAYVAKLNPTGTALLYGTYIGGTTVTYDKGFGIAVDAAGCAYVTGCAGSSDFPTTAGAFDTVYGVGPPGACVIFVTKLSPAGDALVYASFFSEPNVNQGLAIAVDAGGHAYVTGRVDGTLPATAGAFDTTFVGGTFSTDAFVMKVNPAGTGLVYATFLGGGGSDYGNAITVNAAGEAYVTGVSAGGFPTTAGAYKTIGGGDAFVTKLDAAGSAVLRSTYLGGGGTLEDSFGIGLDAAGNVIVGGMTDSGNFPTTAGAYDTTYGGGLIDGFVSKLSPDLDLLLASTFIGGVDRDRVMSLACDALGNVVVAGEAYTAGLPTTADALFPTRPFVGAGFVARLNPSLTTASYFSYLPDGTSLPVALDSEGNLVLAGRTGAPVLITPGAYSAAGGPGYALKLRFNTRPGVAVGPAATLIAGQSFDGTLSISDPDGGPFDVTLNFGDLTPPLVLDDVVAGPVAFSHVYASAAGSPFTLSASVQDPLGVTGTHSVQIIVITPQTAVLNLKTDLAGKTLADRYKSVLSPLLDRALARISAGQSAMAVAQLRSFLAYVVRYESAGSFAPPGSSASLVAAVNALIDALTP